MAIFSREALQDLGFLEIGENVVISDRASIYNPGKIALGNNVRIDDFCVLSAGEGGIVIGDHVHIAVGCSLIGQGRITLSDFSGLSSRVSIYSSSDDYSGASLTNPTIPNEFKNVSHADVYLGKHVIIGSGCVILPGVTIEDGAGVGALSLVSKRCLQFGMYSGIPARRIGERKRNLLDLEKRFLASNYKSKES